MVPLYIVLHIRLQVRHWSNLSEFSFCIRLSALNSSANNFKTSQKCHQVKEAGTLFCLRASRHRNMFFCFPIYLPIGIAYCIRWNHDIIATHCRVSFFRSSSTTQALFFFFFVDRQVSYSSLSHLSSVLAANDRRLVLTFQVKSFLQRSSTFSLASASRVQHDNESWHARQRANLQPKLVQQSNACVGWCVHAKKKPYHNVAQGGMLRAK